MKETLWDFINNPANKIYFTAIISLFIFITGGIVKYLFQKSNEFKKRKDIRNTIKILISKTISELEVSESNVFKFHKTVSIEHNQSWSLTHKELTYLDTFYELKFTDIYEAYRIKRKWKFCFCNRKKDEISFHKLWASLKVLKFTENRIEPDLITMVDKHIGYHNKYKDALGKFRLNFDHLMVEVNGKELPSKIAEFINKQDLIWFDWQNLDEDKRTDYYITYNYVIKPSLDLIKEYYELEITKVFDKDLLDCTHQYIQMQALLNTYKNQFYSHYLSYRTVRRKMKVINRIINNST
ncbi:MAG: hypothetical protein N4A45_12465 [Flavobacteriales bacterium]|jgi:hypothetical protein|nr:hypothetical protein [Flavobacteriales bacterium]